MWLATMANRIFYAWQSDTPNNLNRGFIRKALDKAVERINAELDIEDAVRVDQDTANVSGSPPIAQTIFAKIDDCAVFVPDVTLVSDGGSGRLTSNPNVMIEYGYALRAIGDTRIVAVMNTAFGMPDNLPFDMRHRRYPIPYSASSEHPSEKLSAMRNDLSKYLERAILGVIATTPTWASPKELTPPDLAQYDSFRKQYWALRPKESNRTRLIGFWVGLLPVEPDFHIERPYGHPEIFERKPNVAGTFSNSRDALYCETMDELGDGHVRSDTPTPIHHGGRRRWSRKYFANTDQQRPEEDFCEVSVASDGRIQISVKTTHLKDVSVSVRWVIADLANALRIADDVRKLANRNNTRYWVIVELSYDQYLNIIEPVEGQLGLGFLNEEPDFSGKLPTSRLTLGPYLVGDKSEFPIYLKTVLDELHNAAGKPHVEDFQFQPF